MNYFLTFRTYGTWLHGDERGSVDRFHNQVGTPLLGADEKLQHYRQRLMKTPPVILNGACRACVEQTVREVAHHRGWTIHAVNALSNHVHIVVETTEAPEKANPDKVLADFKSYATRRLRENKLMDKNHDVWEYHGSTRYLKTEEALQRACYYVLHCQDEDNAASPCEPRA